MKRVANIATRILTVYFIALPILFGCHAIHHVHDCDEDYHNGVEYTQLTPDCELCDLYHSQAATVETLNFYEANIQWISFQTETIATLAELSIDFIFLRGPPEV
ncbi:MAG: hypothetical protein JXR03_03625 [Cyclobacteriaceae bacterium]